MIQNIKVDVIYYRTPTDFEMEFNMCGCCRMRLLTGKVSERKELVNKLAQAVQRSRVIIACGPLFAEGGLIQTVASAISRKTVRINGAEYGMSGVGDIDIIEDAVPLVTPEGVFGGCVIESGPQSIILLTENKSLRKGIMKELIHPYIEELSIGTVHREAVSDAAVGESEPVTEQEEIAEPMEIELAEESEEPEPIAEPAVLVDAVLPEDARTEKAQEHTVPFEMEKGAPLNLAEAFGEEIPAAELVPENTVTEIEAMNDIYREEDVDEPPVRKKRSGLNLPIILLSVMLLLLLAVIAYILIYIPLSTNQDILQYIRSLFETAVSTGGM